MGNFIQVKDYVPKIGDIALGEWDSDLIIEIIKIDSKHATLLFQYKNNKYKDGTTEYFLGDVASYFKKFLIKRVSKWEISYK